MVDFKFRINEDTPFVNIEDGRMFIETSYKPRFPPALGGRMYWKFSHLTPSGNVIKLI